MLTAGVDTGSLAAKAVIFDSEVGTVVGSACLATGADPAAAGMRALQMALEDAEVSIARIAATVATGYGRGVLPTADWRVTEITCAARGAHLLDAGVRTVIDIGGQDSKVIHLDGDGFPADFALNDRCAAGTGRFLEVMAGALGVQVEALGELALSAAGPAPITRTCTVFAESEVIGLLAQGRTAAEVAAGLCRAAALRVAQLVAALRAEPRFMLIGGVAQNEAIRHELARVLETELVTPAQPQLVVATGAAVVAAERVDPRWSPTK